MNESEQDPPKSGVDLVGAQDKPRFSVQSAYHG